MPSLTQKPGDPQGHFVYPVKLHLQRDAQVAHIRARTTG